jgi:hypothetical protein
LGLHNVKLGGPGTSCPGFGPSLGDFYKPIFLLFASVMFLAVLPAKAFIDASLQMQLGNPSSAISDTNYDNHYLIQRAVEAIDYSDNLGEPNRASWDLTAGDVGTNARSSKFLLGDRQRLQRRRRFSLTAAICVRRKIAPAPTMTQYF